MKQEARIAVAAAAVVTLAVLAGAASAAKIVGTPAKDVLRGTARADTLDAKGGNDRLYGLGGNDALVGGAGNDVLDGGKGSDTIRCGPGRDTVMVGAGDKIAADCERLNGVEKLATVSIDDVSVTEGNAGTSTLSFRINVAGTPLVPVSIRYVTADGTAAAPADYAPASGTVTLTRTQPTATVEVAVNGDVTVEQDETVRLVLNGPVGARVGRGEGTGTIGNDDSTALSIGDASVDEGDTGMRTMSFPVTLTNPSAVPVSVTFATADGTAASPTDFVAANGTITFAPGQLAQSVAVTINGDIAVEPDETFTVTLGGPSGAALGRGTATGTIRNEDRPRARTGRYAGTTAQGKAVRFDVTSDASSVVNLVYVVDLTCPSIGRTIPDFPLDFPGMAFPIGPDLTFGFEDSSEDADGSVRLVFAGTLTPSGTASGTLRFDITVKNTAFGTVSCTTDTIGWSVS